MEVGIGLSLLHPASVLAEPFSYLPTLGMQPFCRVCCGARMVGFAQHLFASNAEAGTHIVCTPEPTEEELANQDGRSSPSPPTRVVGKWLEHAHHLQNTRTTHRVVTSCGGRGIGSVGRFYAVRRLPPWRVFPLLLAPSPDATLQNVGKDVWSNAGRPAGMR